MTLHQCEAGEAYRAMGVKPELAECRQVGIVFVRDAEGYGHWVCEEHRRAYKLAAR